MKARVETVQALVCYGATYTPLSRLDDVNTKLWATGAEAASLSSFQLAAQFRAHRAMRWFVLPWRATPRASSGTLLRRAGEPCGGVSTSLLT